MLIHENPLASQLEEVLSQGYGNFPDSLFLIEVSEGMYAANNISLPDGQSINGLAAFPSADDAVVYMGLDMVKGISGQIVGKSFEEARQIAISKPKLGALLLFVDGRIADIVYVR